MAGSAECVDSGGDNTWFYEYSFVPPGGNHVETIVPTRANREGDTQGLPTINDGQDIQSIVIEEIIKRREVGIERYGTPLQAHNGRDALRDAFEEALDLTMYLMQAIVERDNG